MTASVRLRTLEDGDTDAHLIAPSLPRSPLHYHPLWPAGADSRGIRVPEWLPPFVSPLSGSLST
ncbi:MAG: hypothetical protein M1399_08000 [Actinobacteria bacterium]|nr:hypothetical protein [Actinomycetota bacterium]MCL5446617.1 hypothetical protein [Actinomycetota bacterium]